MSVSPRRPVPGVRLDSGKRMSDNPLTRRCGQAIDGSGLPTLPTTGTSSTASNNRRCASHSTDRRCANAFRPHTVDELYRVLDHARMSPDVGRRAADRQRTVTQGRRLGVLLPAATSASATQRLPVRVGRVRRHRRTSRGPDGCTFLEVQAADPVHAEGGHLPGQRVGGGGGHSLHVTCDLTLASREHARFKQTDADVGSFDGGYGSAYLAKQVGQKFAREIFFLGRPYTASRCTRWRGQRSGDHADLESVGLQVGGGGSTVSHRRRSGCSSTRST